MNTAYAEVQLKLFDANVPLPPAINLSTSVATNNNDILEDMLTDANTTHCTNSIMVQHVIPTVLPEPTIIA